MSRFVHKSHNVSVLVYHVVCVAKYRRVVFDELVEVVLREVCLDLALRFEITFLEIGTGCPLGGATMCIVHFLVLVQAVPVYSPTKIVTLIKSLIAREVFARCPQVKKKLWGGEFWSDGYFISTVGAHGSEEMIKRYIKEQGKLSDTDQLTLF